jgi:hypothetical protein
VVKKIVLGFLAVLILLLAFLFMVGRGFLGSHEDPGTVTDATRSAAVVDAAVKSQNSGAMAIGAASSKQILFGDLHVHSTFSFDAFLISLPLAQGEGAHPPADACDFARFCSALDFWSINDHSEGISPRHWRETVDSIRQCNEVSGDPANPDVVAFLGWEWTDVGTTPEDHYGHKNVVLKHTDEARIPTRPIAAASTVRRTRAAARFSALGLGALLMYAGDDRYHDLARFFEERREIKECPTGVNVRELPGDCLETAETPADLYRKLDEWGHDAIVIPHGTTWGLYTPPGSTWEKQLQGPMHDPRRQTLFEIYSGHGNSDVYRDWRAVEFDSEGAAVCPRPRAEYLPPCWRAGEIILERCLKDGVEASKCEERAVEARADAAAALSQAHLTVPGTDAGEWLDAGQCRDCEQPSFNYRPGGSAQYVMALGNFDDPEKPRHFRFGFMSSSDNHFARPGTGYKEVNRVGFTESRPGGSPAPGPVANVIAPPVEEPESRSRPFDRENSRATGFALFELERQSSFFMTGGLIAAHSAGRDRDAVWDAMQRREVYGTSGPRILLWFDLINPPGTRGQPIAMGGEATMRENPIFQVRAAGSFEQLPGCPDYAVSALGEAQLQRVCKGECYHPSDRRRTITRIEVARILPQQRANEQLADLIEDAWRSFDCDPNPEGCVVSFTDPDYETAGRNAVYYVRAFETPAPAVNAGGVRCEYDAAGRCIDADLCRDPDSDCLETHEPKAWSSPIFVDWPAEREVALH